MRSGIWGVCLTTTLLGVATLLTACDSGEQQSSSAPPSTPPGVVVEPVAQIPVTEQASFTGRIQAVSEVDLLPRIEGFLEKRVFTEGAQVAEGDVLFTIQRTNYEAAVKSAQGNLMRAQANAKLADLEVQRQTILVRNRDAAQARLDTAVAQKGDADGAVLQAEAALTQAQLNLSYTTITAPISGRIGEAAVDQGTLITPSTGTLATIVSTDPMYAIFPVSASRLLKIRKQAQEDRIDVAALVASLTLGEGSTYQHDGKIDFVNVTANEGSDTVLVRAVFPNPEGYLVNDQVALVTVRAGEPQQALGVAQAAVLADQQGPYVLVVDKDDVVAVRRVQLGASIGTNVVVTSGLTEGERVIVDGVQKVRLGQKVTPTQSAVPRTSVSGGTAQ